MDSETETKKSGMPDKNKLLEAIRLVDRSIKLRQEQVKLTKELRRVLAREAIKAGVMSGKLVAGQPCPLCGHLTTLYASMVDFRCPICQFDGRGS